MNTIPRMFLFVGIVGLGTMNAGADQIVIDPVSATAPDVSQNTGTAPVYNGTGFSAADIAAMATGQPVPTTWGSNITAGDPAGSTVYYGNNWVSDSSAVVGGGDNSIAGEYLDLNLGASYNLGGFNFWAFSGDGEEYRTLASALISVSSDGVNFTPVGTYSFYQSNGEAGLGPVADPVLTYDTGHFYTLPAGTSGQYVEFSNLVSVDPGINVGISEIRFVTAVPEPASLILLGIGAAGCWMTRRRRRKAS